jgi:hypothetical protein
MAGQHRGAVSTGLAVAALVAVALTVVVTDRFGDAVLFVLAVGLFIASYAARRRARDVFLYGNRDNP